RRGRSRDLDSKCQLLVRGLPNQEEMTLLGQSQGRGYASTEARVPALNVRSSVLTCTNQVRSGSAAAVAGQATVGSWKASIFDDCPMCAKAPVEPVRVDGSWPAGRAPARASSAARRVCRGMTPAPSACVTWA